MADNRRSMHLPTPHFFKPLISGFLTNFSIPKSFLKHLGFEESTNDNDFIAVLKDPSRGAGNVESKSWTVQLDSDGRRFLNGWKEFADDHGLTVGEFIVFNHIGGFEFEVVVFDPISACPRFSAPEKTRLVKYKRGKKRADYKTSGNPFFRASVQNYCFIWSAMLLPIRFARNNGLTGRSCKMIVIDEKDRSWTFDLKPRQGRACLSSGWSEFAAANGLKVGDNVVYEVIKSGSRPVMKFYKEG